MVMKTVHLDDMAMETVQMDDEELHVIMAETEHLSAKFDNHAGTPNSNLPAPVNPSPSDDEDINSGDTNDDKSLK